MALRLRLLRFPASLDVGDAEGGIVCRCNRRVNILEDAMHFFHCPTSQGQFICRHNHIRDAIIDQIGGSVDNQPGNEGPHIEVEWEPLVRAHAPPAPDPPPSPPRADGAMEVDEAVVAPRFANGEEDGFIEEAGLICQKTLSITDLRQRNIDDKAAGQRRGDLAVYVDGSRLIVDVAVADATARTLLLPTTPTTYIPSRRVPDP